MSVDLLDRVLGERRLRVVVSERIDGDLHPRRADAGDLDARQHALIGRRFALAEQVHGVDALTLAADQPWPLCGSADVIVTPLDAASGTPVAVWAADCAPVVLFGSRGTVVGAHAGWRGLAAGVLDVAATVVSARGESVVAAVVGPVIHPECYAFGARDLVAVAAGVGVDPAAIAGVTTDGSPALDVPAAVVAGLHRHGIDDVVIGSCTGCDTRWYSHRVRGEAERHAVIAWTEPAKLDR